MREIDGFLIGAVRSKMCATVESEVSMVHEGSSVRIEQGNIIMIIFILYARSWLTW